MRTGHWIELHKEAKRQKVPESAIGLSLKDELFENQRNPPHFIRNVSAGGCGKSLSIIMISFSGLSKVAGF